MNSAVAGHHEQLEGIAADCGKMLHLLPEATARHGVKENCAELIAVRTKLESVIQRCAEERTRLKMDEATGAQTLEEIDDELSAISKAAQVLLHGRLPLVVTGNSEATRLDLPNVDGAP